MKKLLILLFAFSTIFIASCKKKNVIEKEKFAEVYVEILISQEKYKGDFAKADSSRKVIYSKYEITDEQYHSTLENYGSDQKKWDDFFELVNKKIDELQKNNKNKK